MGASEAAIAIVAMIVGGIVILGVIIALIVWMSLSHTRRLQQIKSSKELEQALAEQRDLRAQVDELRDRLNQQILEDEKDVQRRLNA